MFNLSLAVRYSMKIDSFKTKQDCRDFLDSNCIDKIIVSLDKVVYRFEDESLLCCDGNNILARGVGADINEFLH